MVMLILRFCLSGPSPPLLNVKPINSDKKIRLTWEAPLTPNGEILEYRLRYGFKPTPQDQVKSWKLFRFTADNTEYFYEPADIYPGWTYVFALSAVNTQSKILLSKNIVTIYCTSY